MTASGDAVSRRRGLCAALDALIGFAIAAGSVLVLPLSLLLFLQWPLREGVQAYSREANDLAQTLFAVYVAMAITCATRRHVHLASDALAQRYPPGVRSALMRAGALAAVAPWAAFVLYASWPIVAQSVRQLESFPETYNPGYFVIKAAVFLLALLALLQATLDLFRRTDAAPR